MKSVLAVGLGGFFGSIARYLTGVLIIRFCGDAPVFPYATLLVNIVGCFLIGLFGAVAESARWWISPEVQMFVVVGLLGGFTTYSAFGYQTLTLAGEGRMLSSALNVAAHLILGLGAVWVGGLMGRQL